MILAKGMLTNIVSFLFVYLFTLYVHLPCYKMHENYTRVQSKHETLWF